MASKKSVQPPMPVTMYTFVGNIGCLRFPKPIRKASGIKRGDRLAVNVLAPDSVCFKKLDPLDQVPTGEPPEVKVEGCACANPPEACSQAEKDTVTVGWSYVQLNEELAFELGFLPHHPVKLVGESSQITAFLHRNLSDLEGIPHTPCPP